MKKIKVLLVFIFNNKKGWELRNQTMIITVETKQVWIQEK